MNEAVSSTLHPWYALKVRTLSEPKAVVGLRTRGYDPFCPVYQERRRYCDRVRVIEQALFPGYLFCRFDPSLKLPVITSESVEYIVSVDGFPAPIPEAQISDVRRAIEGGARPVPYPSTGQRVRVQAGPFAGIEGVLTGDADRSTLIVSVDLLQGAIALHIDKLDVAPL